MNGVSVGAVASAGVAYDIHNPISNQENQGLTKVNSNGIRSTTAANPRVPLSNLPAGRAELNDYGQPNSQQAEDVGKVKSRSKNGLEVESQYTTSKRNTSTGNLSRAESDDIPENMYRPDKDDVEGWIHREKLAKIENEELQAAGINLAKARTKSTRTASRDRLRNDFVATEGLPRGEKRRYVSSPTPAHTSDDPDGDERSNWDFRTPEEIAADNATSQTYITPVLRKQGSKIPILAPNAAGHAQSEGSERETPILRKRTMSDSISNEDDLHSPKIRPGSSRWNDEPQDTQPISSNKPNPAHKSKQKSISSGPGPSVMSKNVIPRKTSAAKQNTTSPANRPRTRGNDTERPRTAVNPPEGDPPWLADMYKPDPRLPPDQQLIPTLAKKRQQQQWEENGMIPRTYDREFTPLAVHEGTQQPPVRIDEPETAIDRPEDSESWPLKPMTGVRALKDSPTKPNTNGISTTGGYSTMPKVSSPPMSITSPKIGSTSNANPTNLNPTSANPTSANPTSPNPNASSIGQSSSNQQQKQGKQLRPQPPSDEDDEKVQKKGCGCCIVM